MIITVEELLDSKNMSGLKIIAGLKGIKNEIRNTIITDNPDYFDLLSAGDIIITTGYPFFVLKDDPNFQVNTIKMLATTNCAALAIKTKKYFDALPAPILEKAEELGFPIIEIAKEMSLTQVDSMIKKKLGTDNESLLARTIEVQNKLMDATFGGIDKILEEIVSLTDNPVAIVDINWKILSYKIGDHDEVDLKLYSRKKLFFKETIEKLKLEEMTSQDHLNIDYEINEEQTINCIIFPINDKKQIHGYIILWETLKKFEELDYVTLERASTIFALDMKRTKELETKRNKIRSNFFEDLIGGKLKDTSANSNLAELYGIDVTKSYACLVIKIDLASEEEGLKSHKMEPKYYMDRVIEISYEVSENHKSNILHIVRGNYIIIFLPIKKTEDLGDGKYFSKQFAEEIYQKTTKQIANLNLAIGIGKCYDHAFDLSHSFNEALEVITLARKIELDHKVLHFDDYIIYHFLKSNISDDNLEKFYETTLAKLVKYDVQRNTNLIVTLERYLKNQKNSSLTAKELYLHRNTLIHRLNKISEILKVDLDDSEKVLELQLALKAMKILKIKSL